MAENIGIEGKKNNHSARKTMITNWFQKMSILWTQVPKSLDLYSRASNRNICPIQSVDTTKNKQYELQALLQALLLLLLKIDVDLFSLVANICK